MGQALGAALTWVGHDQMAPEGVEGAEGGARGVPGAHQRLRAAADGVAVDQRMRQFGREFGRDVGQVVLRRHQTGRVVHLDLQVGQRVQQGRVGHGDLISDVVQSVNRTSVQGSSRGQVRRSREQIRYTQKHTSGLLTRCLLACILLEYKYMSCSTFLILPNT